MGDANGEGTLGGGALGAPSLGTSGSSGCADATRTKSVNRTKTTLRRSVTEEEVPLRGCRTSSGSNSNLIQSRPPTAGYTGDWMWIDRAVQWLLPREDRFFELLTQGADCALASSRLLLDCCLAGTFKERVELVVKIGEAEHAADKVIRDVYEALNRTFVTPIDRSDIYMLATELEDISDAVHATGLQVAMYSMDVVPSGSSELAAIIQTACERLQKAVGLLRTLKRGHEIRTHCEAVRELERDGDKIFRAEMSAMFKNETNAVALLKHKEFLEGLEHTLDVCENVANILETIVLKNA